MQASSAEEEHGGSHVPCDLIQLAEVKPENILNALQARFEKDCCYTSIGPILVAINPFKWMKDIYADDIKKEYNSEMRTLTEDPHVFGIAHAAHYGLQFGRDQSLIISGESGAGKTESTKQCLSYLAYVGGKSPASSSSSSSVVSEGGVQQRILRASPILEAWGNAKTLRNDNSSRFGKFIEVWFARGGSGGGYSIVGANNTTYLLEKSRIAFQERGERNYHAFYQLLGGAPAEVLRGLQLTDFAADPSKAEFLNKSGCMSVASIDEKEAYREVEDAYRQLGLTEADAESLRRVLAGVLHMGNLRFVPSTANADEIDVAPACAARLAAVVELFGLEESTYKRALLFKKTQIGKRTSCTYSPLAVQVAAENSNALAKDIYARCFDWIVRRINGLVNAAAVPADSGRAGDRRMIGILDIFGFEIFQKNSFEQLCINLANEALQRHFNENIFQREVEIYKAEDITVPELHVNDNQDVLDLIMKRPIGIIAMLDEEGVLPKGSMDGFLNKLKKLYPSHKRLKFKQGTAPEFTVNHFAGDVRYETALFMAKNKDTLSQDLVEVASCSGQPFIAALMTDGETGGGGSGGAAAAGGAGGRPMSTKNNKQTVGGRFRDQLNSLIETLNATEPRYIRCIKPNHDKLPNRFTAELVNEQLLYSGVFDAVVIMQTGYAFRLEHLHFFERYQGLVVKAGGRQQLFTQAMKADARARCALLIKLATAEYGEAALGGCHSGKTMILYRAEQHKCLERLRTQAIKRAVAVLQRNCRMCVHKTLARKILKAAAVCKESFLHVKESAQLSAVADTLNALCDRFSAVSPFKGPLKIHTVLMQYTSALDTLVESSRVLRDQLANRKQCLEEARYARLCQAMDAAKAICVSVSFEGKTVEVNWTSDSFLQNAAAELVTIGSIVTATANLRKGIEQKDELVLEASTAQLEALRGSKDVEVDYCRDEEAQAAKIIQFAKNAYEAALVAFSAALQSGQLKFNRKGKARDSSGADLLTDATSFSVACSHGQLENLVKEYSLGRGDGTSARVGALVELCKGLIDLRKLVTASQWEAIAAALPRWGAYWSPAPTDAEEGSGVAEGDQEFVVLKEIAGFVTPEIQRFHVVALLKTKVSAVHKHCWTSCRIAEVVGFATDLQGCGDSGWIVSEESPDAGRVHEYIDLLHRYDGCQDEFLGRLLEDLEHHHALYRQAEEMCKEAGDEKACAALRALVEKLQARCASSHNYRQAEKLLFITETKNLLVKAMVVGAGEGRPGHLHYSASRNSALENAVQHITQEFPGKLDATWTSCVKMFSVVRDLRKIMAEISSASDLAQRSRLIAEAEVILREWASGGVSSMSWSRMGDERNALVQAATDEIDVLGREIRHFAAFSSIGDCLKEGRVRGDVGDIDTSSCSFDKLQAALASHRHHIIVTQDDVGDSGWCFLRDCDVVVEARRNILAADWDAVDAVFTAEFVVSTDNCARCHESCVLELELIHGEVRDRGYRQTLVDMIQRYPLQKYFGGDAAFHVLSKASEEVLFADLRELLQEVRQVEQLDAKSFDLQFMLSSARGLILLEHLVAGPKARWGVAPFVDQSLGADEHAAAVAARLSSMDGSDGAAAFVMPMFAEIVSGGCYNPAPSLDCEALTMSELLNLADGNLTVGSVLHYLHSVLGVHSAIRDSVQFAQRLFLERACRTVLLLAACSNGVRGSNEAITVEGVETKMLVEAVAYVAMHQPASEPDYFSETMMNLLQYCRVLLNVRLALKNVSSPGAGSKSFLWQLFSVADLVEVYEKLTSSPLMFKSAEFELVIDFLRQSAALHELRNLLPNGAPHYLNGNFDESSVSFEPLRKSVAAAEALGSLMRSLRAFVGFADLAWRARRAVHDGSWDSGVDQMCEGAQKREGGESVLGFLRKFDALNAAANSSVDAESSPQCLVDEFRILKLEHDRRLLVAGFAESMISDALVEEGGGKGMLALRHVRFEALEGHIAKAQQWTDEMNAHCAAQRRSSGRDETDEEAHANAEILAYIKASLEIVEIKKKLCALHRSYADCGAIPEELVDAERCSSGGAAEATEALAKGIVTGAVGESADICARLLDSPRPLSTEWAPIVEAVSHLGSTAVSKPFKFQLELLHAETFCRGFICRATDIFHELARLSISKGAGLPPRLLITDAEAEHFLEQIHSLLQFHNAHAHGDVGTILKSNATLDLLRISAVILLHLIVSVRQNLHDDSVNYSWRSNRSNVPSIAALQKVLSEFSADKSFSWSSKFTIEDVIRCALAQQQLHGVVDRFISGIAEEIDNMCSFEALSSCMKHAEENNVEALSKTIITNEFLDAIDYGLQRIRRCTPIDPSNDDSSLRWLVESCMLAASLMASLQAGEADRAALVLHDFIANQQSGQRSWSEEEGGLVRKIDDLDGKPEIEFLFEAVLGALVKVHPLASKFISWISLRVVEQYWMKLANEALLSGPIEKESSTHKKSDKYCNSLNCSQISCDELNFAISLLDKAGIFGNSLFEAPAVQLYDLCNFVRHLRTVTLASLKGAHQSSRVANIEALQHDVGSTKFESALVLEWGGLNRPASNSMVPHTHEFAFDDILVHELTKRVRERCEGVPELAGPLGAECDTVEAYANYSKFVHNLLDQFNAPIFRFDAAGIEVNRSNEHTISETIKKGEELFGITVSEVSEKTTGISSVDWWYQWLLTVLDLFRRMFEAVPWTQRVIFPQSCTAMNPNHSGKLITLLEEFKAAVESVRKHAHMDKLLPPSIAQTYEDACAFLYEVNCISELVKLIEVTVCEASGEVSEEGVNSDHPSAVCGMLLCKTTSNVSDLKTLKHSLNERFQMKSSIGVYLLQLAAMHVEMRLMMAAKDFAGVSNLVHLMQGRSTAEASLCVIKDNNAALFPSVDCVIPAINATEVAMVEKFCNSLSARVSLEFNLSQCVLPSAIGWSLHWSFIGPDSDSVEVFHAVDPPNAAVVAISIIDTPLRNAVAYCESLQTSAEVAANPALGETLALSKILLRIVDEIRAGNWTHEPTVDQKSSSAAVLLRAIAESNTMPNLSATYKMPGSSAGDENVQELAASLEKLLAEAKFVAPEVKKFLSAAVSTVKVEVGCINIQKTVRGALVGSSAGEFDFPNSARGALLSDAVQILEEAQNSELISKCPLLSCGFIAVKLMAAIHAASAETENERTQAFASPAAPVATSATALSTNQEWGAIGDMRRAIQGVKTLTSLWPRSGGDASSPLLENQATALGLPLRAADLSNLLDEASSKRRHDRFTAVGACADRWAATMVGNKDSHNVRLAKLQSCGQSEVVEVFGNGAAALNVMDYSEITIAEDYCRLQECFFRFLSCTRIRYFSGPSGEMVSTSDDIALLLQSVKSLENVSSQLETMVSAGNFAEQARVLQNAADAVIALRKAYFTGSRDTKAGVLLLRRDVVASLRSLNARGERNTISVPASTLLACFEGELTVIVHDIEQKHLLQGIKDSLEQFALPMTMDAESIDEFEQILNARGRGILASQQCAEWKAGDAAAQGLVGYVSTIQWPERQYCDSLSTLLECSGILSVLCGSVVGGKWAEVISFAETEQQKLHVSGQAKYPAFVMSCLSEAFNRARRFGVTCQLHHSCIDALSQGAAKRPGNGPPDAPLDAGVKSDGLKTVLESLAAVDEAEWLTAATDRIRNSCEVVYVLRVHAQTSCWAHAFDVANKALSPAGVAIKPLHATQGRKEIEFVRDYSATRLIVSLLTHAMGTFSLSTPVGTIDTAEISARAVHCALTVTRRLLQSGGDHIATDYVQGYIDQATIIYKLRRAAIAANWSGTFSVAQAASYLCGDTEHLCDVPVGGLGSYVEQSEHPPSGRFTDIDSTRFWMTSIMEWTDAEAATGVDASLKSGLLLEDGPQAILEHIFRFDPNWADGAAVGEDSVEVVLQGAGAARFTKTGAFAKEIALFGEHLLFLRLVHSMAKALSHAGITGVPGHLNVPVSLHLKELKCAIEEAASESIPVSVREHHVIAMLLSNARLLRSARQNCVDKNWGNLRSLLVALDEGADTVLHCIRDEVALVRADMQLRNCFDEFAALVKQQPVIPRHCRGSRKNKYVNSFYQEQIDKLQQLVVRTAGAAADDEGVWGSESVGAASGVSNFDRLLKAQRLALDLLIFKQYHSYQSPKNTVQRILAENSRDRKSRPSGAVPYIDVLLDDVAMIMGNCSRAEVLEMLEREVTDGQLYLYSPVGFINTEDLCVRALQGAITAAKQLLQETGSALERELIAVAESACGMRDGIKRQGWAEVAGVLHHYVNVIQPSLTGTYYAKLIADEVERVAIEVENRRAGSMLKAALTNGRITNVFSLAAMFHAEKQLELIPDAAQRNKMRSSIVSAKLQDDVSGSAGDGTSLQFQHIQALSIAIQRAEGMVFKSEDVVVLIKTGKLIRHMRKCIHEGRWAELEAIVCDVNGNSVVHGLLENSIPAYSLEEISTAKAGLKYRHCLTALSSALVSGKVYGTTGHVHISSLDYMNIQTALFELDSLQLDDYVLTLLSQVGLLVCNVRRAIKDSRWFVDLDDGEDGYDGQGRHVVVEDQEEDSYEVPNITMDSLSQLSVEQIVVFYWRHKDVLTGPLRTALSTSGKGGQQNEHLFSSVNLPTQQSVSASSRRDSRSSIVMFAARTDDGVPETDVYWRAVESVMEEMVLITNEVNDRKAKELLISGLVESEAAVETVGQQRGGGSGSGGAEGLHEVETEGGAAAEDRVESLQVAVQRVDEMMATKVRRSSSQPSFSVHTQQLLTTARLVLKFRVAVQQSNLEEFKRLVDHTHDLLVHSNSKSGISDPASVSSMYGLQELTRYMSISTTASFAASEAEGAMQTGCVRGPLNVPWLERVETYALRVWLESTTAMLATMHSGDVLIVDRFRQLVVEAELLLQLRVLCQERRWGACIAELEAHNVKLIDADAAETEIGALPEAISSCNDEVRHISMVCMYHEGIAAVERLSAEVALTAETVQHKAQCRAALQVHHMAGLRRAIGMLEAVRRYLPSAASFAGGSTGPSVRDMLLPNWTDFENYLFAAKSLLKLWTLLTNYESDGNNPSSSSSTLQRTISGGMTASDAEQDDEVSWEISPIAAGDIHRYDKAPSDPLLAHFFFHYLGMHELANRMADVHRHLKQIGCSHALRQRGGEDGGGGANRRSIGERAQATVYQPDAEPAAESSKPTPSGTGNGAACVVPPSPSKGRRANRVSVYSGAKPGGAGADIADSARAATASAGPASPVASNPAAKMTRRSSIGMAAISTTKGRAKAAPAVTIARLLCECDWNAFPPRMNSQFNVVRDVFIDKVVRRRLQSCCAAGGLTVDGSGEIAISSNSTELLDHSIDEAEKILRRARQLGLSLEQWSPETRTWIQTAKFFGRCRELLIAGDKIQFVQELQREGYLQSRFVNPNQFSTEALRRGVAAETKNAPSAAALQAIVACNREGELLEKYGWECIGEQLVRHAVAYLVQMTQEFSPQAALPNWRRSSGTTSASLASAMSMPTAFANAALFSVSQGNTKTLLMQLQQMAAVCPYAMRQPTAYYQRVVGLVVQLRKLLLLAMYLLEMSEPVNRGAAGGGSGSGGRAPSRASLTSSQYSNVVYDLDSASVTVTGTAGGQSSGTGGSVSASTPTFDPRVQVCEVKLALTRLLLNDAETEVDLDAAVQSELLQAADGDPMLDWATDICQVCGRLLTVGDSMFDA